MTAAVGPKFRQRGVVLEETKEETKGELEYAPSHLPPALLERDMDYDKYIRGHRQQFADARTDATSLAVRFDEVRAIAAYELKRIPGTDDLTFEIGPTSSAGVCAEHFQQTHRIVMSPVFAAIAPLAEIRETVIHEIAHGLSPTALDGGDLHGPKWWAKVKAIGARSPSARNPMDILLRPVLYRCRNHPTSKWHFKRLAVERTAEMDETLCLKCRGPLEAVRNPDHARDKRVVAAAVRSLGAVSGRCVVCEAVCADGYCSVMCRRTHALRC